MKTDELKKISDRIKRGERYWKKENKEQFESFRNYLKIKHPLDTDKDKITVPYIHSLIRSELPSLYYKNPTIIVTPRKKINPQLQAQTIANQPIVDAVMKYLPDEIDLEDQGKKVVLDSRAFGRGVIKIGYEFELDEAKKKNAVQKVVDTAKKMVGVDTQEDVPKILIDRFYVKRLSYPTGMFIYDPDAIDGLKDARWCAEKIIEPLEDVKNNKLFSNTKDLKSNCRSNQYEVEGDKTQYGAEIEEELTYWLYWEKNRFGVVDKYCYLVMDQDIELKSGANPYKHKEFPYEDLDANDIPDYLFPVGDILPVVDQQDELDALESIQIRHAKSMIQKYLANKGKLDPKARTALESPDHNIIEVVDDTNLRPLENPSINSSLPVSSDMIKEDMTKIMGVSDYDQASVPANKVTLGEAQMIQAGSNSRRDEQRQRVEKFMKRVIRKLYLTVQPNITEEMTLLITGDGSKPEDWVTFNGDMLEGEFDFDIEPRSMTPPQQQQMRNDNLELYKLLGSDPELSIEARDDLRKGLLESYDKRNLEVYKGVPVPPAAVKEDKPNISIAMPYAILPEDVKRQVEALAGFQPSTLPPVASDDQNGQPIADNTQPDNQPPINPPMQTPVEPPQGGQNAF